MLVLTRKRQESVVIGGADGFSHLLNVTVLGISGGTVRLGFEVDASVPVHRAEVWERISAHGQADSSLVGAATAGSAAPVAGRFPDRSGS
ncbi:MAG: carbon storage regulator [Pirellulaceae bacterium]